ncbi:MAG: T9SS type A sorting domain-containing protein [Dysgonamonadaceae bacterium]|nr:T9SS type A sorting domain-containing protein [Dysgonamonadaceae bacterium]
MAAIVRQLSEKDSEAGILKSSKATTGLSELLAAGATLQQNTPNPFTEQTTIRYYLPQDVRSASVCIFDLQGKMLKKLDAPAGDQTLTISGSELRAGTYLYALIADGKKVNTKRMILTK